MVSSSLSALPQHLVASGLPLHTRMLIVDVSQAEREQLRSHGTILDLRKCSFVPTGNDLQTAGLIHHMEIDALVDCATRVIRAFEPAQPMVAFEPSEHTGGESCRDPAPRLRSLVGEAIDHGFSKRLSGIFGGPLGCSHLLTLGQLVASTLPQVLAHEEALVAGGRGARETSERVFKRSVVVDGFDLSQQGEYEVAIQLTDMHMRPRRECNAILDRFDRQHEVRVLARLDATNLTLKSLHAAERVRDRETIQLAEWQSRDAMLTSLAGQPAIGGLGKRLLALLGDEPGARALLDALLNLAPGLIQCMAALAGAYVERAAGGGDLREAASDADATSILNLGGMTDSCYIWRSGSVMNRMRRGGPAE